MPLFEYADAPGETAITCVCGHTCGPAVVCTTCQPQPTLRRCRACKIGGTIIADEPPTPPAPVDPNLPGTNPTPIMPGMPGYTGP